MRVRLVPGHDPGPWTGTGSNTYLIEGRVPVLVDTGSGRPAHLDELQRVIADGGVPPARVLVTHGHPDHAGGAAAVAARWPGATFAKLPHSEDARWPVQWEPLAPGGLVDAGDGQLWVVHTPGHAPDHVCFFEPRTGTLFAGDLVVRGSTVAISAADGGNVRQYLESLRLVLDLQPRRILAGHGPVIEHPAALVRACIAHRLARERQIVDALAAGAEDVDVIVARIYPDLGRGLEHAAHETVLAHLVKLEEDGRVRRAAATSGGASRWAPV